MAGLYSLIATCEANGVNPVDYLADVLIRRPRSLRSTDEPQCWLSLTAALFFIAFGTTVQKTEDVALRAASGAPFGVAVGGAMWARHATEAARPPRRGGRVAARATRFSMSGPRSWTRSRCGTK